MNRPNDPPPDEQLLRQIAEGDSQAFAELFRRRRAEIYRFALHMTGSPATAEDVTQEVFMAVMRDAARYDPARAALQPWLFGITRNFVLRRLDQDRPLHPLGDTHDVQRVGDVPSQVDLVGELARAERIESVRRAIQSLPVRYREVVVLCDLQEVSYVDAAAALNCAVGTVRSRLHRARALLGDKLRDADEAPNIKLRNRRCFA
jgi:RNA polymerase sigma-70 factor (ECF subfamily)